MNITSKNLWLFSIIFFIVITGVIFVIIFSTPDPQSDVIVSYQRPASFDTVKSSPSVVVPATPAPASKATATPIPADQWVLKIQDPLGDPISAGTIAFGSESLLFTCGSVIMPTTAPHELSVRVSADGYAPGEFSVTPNSLPLVLDYLCDFYILVEDENGNPVPNTTIHVWKSNPPPRPAGDETAAYTKSDFSLGNTIHLTRNTEECRVQWVSKPSNEFEINAPRNGFVYPKIGDVIMALGACTWQDKHTPLYSNQTDEFQRAASILGEFLPYSAKRSCRLRIWDTLRLTEQAGSSQSNIHLQRLEILRDNQLFYYNQFFPECAESQPLFLEEKANDQGEWRLRGVPPAIYYVQASDNQNRCSGIMPLHPACSGARLRMRGEGELRVTVEREGVPAKAEYFKRVADADVTLQSMTGTRRYSQKSNIEGKVFYKNLPYGKYRLTVKALGQTVDKMITFNKPYDFIHITLKQEEMYKVTGIVLEKDSGIPVAGYPLELKAGEGLRGYYVYQEVVSDAKGRFEFNDVIPGNYSFSEHAKSLSELNYIFADPTIAHSYFCEKCAYLSSISLNVYENIFDFKIFVKPVVKTTFSGIVVDQKGTPAANAAFSAVARYKDEVFADKAKLIPENFKTNANGLFSLTMFNGYRSDNIYCYELTAMIGGIDSPRWEPDAKQAGNFDFIEEKFHPSSIGSVNMEGKMGDAFKDIQIVLEPHIPDKTLLGKLLAEGEDQFERVHIFANQKNQDVPIEVDKDGYFKAENLAAGEITFAISPGIHSSVNTLCGPQQYWKYCNRTVTIRIKDGQPQTYVEIPLQPAGYYWGFLKDSDGNPMTDEVVYLRGKDDPDEYCGSAVTDQAGFFFISSNSVAANHRYDIKYRIGGLVKTMPGVLPDTGNLLLQ